MKKLWTLRFIKWVSLLGFILLGFSCFSPPQHLEPAQVRGKGIIVVTSEFMTYRDEIRTRERWVSGSTYAPAGGPVSGTAGHTVTETYTVRVAVRNDSNLPFRILQDGREVFRGVTPVRVTNFDPGVRYTIVWVTRNRNESNAWFEISTARPFTRNIHIE